MAMKFRKHGLNCSMMDWKRREKKEKVCLVRSRKDTIQTPTWATVTELCSLLGHEHTHTHTHRQSKLSQPRGKGEQRIHFKTPSLTMRMVGWNRGKESLREGLYLYVCVVLCPLSSPAVWIKNKIWFWPLNPSAQQQTWTQCHFPLSP